jgi:hypothetical protein
MYLYPAAGHPVWATVQANPQATAIAVDITHMDDRNAGTLRGIVTVKGVPTAMTPVAVVTPVQPVVKEAALVVAKLAGGNVIEITGTRFGTVPGDLGVVFSPTLPSISVMRCDDSHIYVSVGDTASGSLYGNISAIVTRNGMDSGGGVVIGHLVEPIDVAPTITNPVLDLTFDAPLVYKHLDGSVSKVAAAGGWHGAYSTYTFTATDVTTGSNHGISFRCTTKFAFDPAAALGTLVVGLSHVRSAKSDASDIAYGFLCRSDKFVQVQECTGSGCTLPSNVQFDYIPGETLFAISVNKDSGAVEYMMDGDVIYTSSTSVTYPLGLDISIGDTTAVGIAHLAWLSTLLPGSATIKSTQSGVWVVGTGFGTSADDIRVLITSGHMIAGTINEATVNKETAVSNTRFKIDIAGLTDNVDQIISASIVVR